MKLEKYGFLKRSGLSVAFAVVMCCLVSHAGRYYWTYEGEGNWGDVTKWHKGSVSGATGELPGIGDEAICSATNCTINVDAEYTVAELSIEFGTADAERICTLKGNGKLILQAKDSATSSGSATSFQINDYSTIVMDGPDIYCKLPEIGGAVQYCEGGTFS